MIYVILYPSTIWEYLRYHITGRAPAITCDQVRSGPGIVECQHGEDACTMLPMSRIMGINWESGYKAAFESARNRYFADMAESMKNMGMASQGGQCNCTGDDCDDDITEPYNPSSSHVDGYS